MIGRMAVCRKDGEPLVMSFEQRGKEFVCIVCGTWYEYLEPNGAEPTPELDARYEVLTSRYAAGERGPVSNQLALDAAYIEKQVRFSEATFGPGERLHGVVDHIRKELLEVLENPTDLAEWADLIILAIDGAWRSGAEPQHIINAVHRKLDKNIGRQWPDWRTDDLGKTIEHIRSPAVEGPTRILHGPTNSSACWDCGVAPGELHLEACATRREILNRLAQESGS